MMKEKIKIGMMGFGQRGVSLLKDAILPRDNVVISAVCDCYADRTEAAAKLVREAGRPEPLQTQDWHDLLKLDIDAVVIATSWESHISCAVAFMEAGIYVGMEVGGAYSVRECWRLVEAYERTGVPCMMLENCCYGREEMALTVMKEQNVLGTLVHCRGGYQHDLRDEVSYGKENRHYRLRNYLHRNSEFYPTHELGPIARLLDINHGNRMIQLSSVASKAEGLHSFIASDEKANKELLKERFAQGDIVTTTITCAGGETIVLSLDTTLPRAYSRGLEVHGTKGMYCEDNYSVFLDDQHRDFHFKWKEKWGNAEEFFTKYEHPVWKHYKEEGIRNGHDGMDWLVFSAFFDAVANETEAPIDVYDAAAWMCITPLSEQSIAMGGTPIAIPDFTSGKWLEK